MAKLIPFPARRVRRTAELVLLLASSRTMFSRRPVLWTNRPTLPAPLGDMLQRLALVKPSAVLVLEHVVADILAQTET